jgi:ribonuclease HI
MLAEHNRVNLESLPGHQSVEGNKRADHLAEKCLTGPEPTCTKPRRG